MDPPGSIRLYGLMHTHSNKLIHMTYLSAVGEEISLINVPVFRTKLFKCITDVAICFEFVRAGKKR